ncbi:MAG: EAL domain-containing protein [Nodosilinea sp.]
MPPSPVPATVKPNSLRRRIGDRLRQLALPTFLYQSKPKVATIGLKTVILSSVMAGALVSGIKFLTVIEPLELFIFDWLVRSQPQRSLHPRITLVGISEDDLQQYGWPMNDDQLATLLATLQAHQPSVIGLDLYRSTRRPPGDTALEKQLAAENLIVIKKVYAEGEGEVPPPPGVGPERVGFNDLPTDADKVTRRTLLYVGRSQDHSFGLRVTLADQAHRGKPLAVRTGGDYLYLGDIPLKALGDSNGGYQAEDSSGYQILMRYYDRQTTPRSLSLSQVLSGQFDPSWVTDNIVLIGSIAPSLKDQFSTPFSFGQGDELTMPGVMVHAQIVSQLLNLIAGEAALYRFLPPWAEGLWLLIWCLGAGALTWTIQRPELLLGGILGLLVGISGVGWLGIHQLVWLPIAEPMLGLLITAAIVTIYKLVYRSKHDPLTGLANREAFITMIQRALHQAASQPVITVFMGIDRFKVINESLGHQAGDQVLRAIAQRLLKHMPAQARVARVGGDEFALLFTHLDAEAAGHQMDRLQHLLSEPINLDGQKFPSTISIGMAIGQPNLEYRPADLLRDAHTAMYRAKALGKTRFEVFAAGMLTEAVNRLQLESDLITALDNQEFLLYYQPIVSLQSGVLAGFEALVRWRQKDRGFVLPSTFIPAAEETGLIMALGQWIFREACRQLRQWQELFPQHQHLTMSINLSNRQFSQPDLVTQIAAALEETQVSGECIRLEITESMVMGDVDRAIDLMLQLKSLDLKLAIDDFGTGYSSLSYLHRFPMDTLKVDKSFVGRLENSNEDRAIIHTILNLGQQLGLAVVAEGIETEAQVAMLKQEGCDYGQGYFFAKPLGHEAVEVLLRQADLTWHHWRPATMANS